MPKVKSSNISSVDYDANTLTLTVNFKWGSAFQYFKVPKPTYDWLLKASSKWKFFYNNIRNKFANEEITQ